MLYACKTPLPVRVFGNSELSWVKTPLPVRVFIFSGKESAWACMYASWACMYVRKPSACHGFWTYIHGPRTYIQTHSNDLRPHAYNLTWRFLDRGSVLFDLRSLDKPICSKTPLPVVLFWHTRFKNQRKRYPWRGIVMLSYIVFAQIDAVSMYVCFIFMIKHMVFRHTYIERKRFAHERNQELSVYVSKPPLPVGVFELCSQRGTVNPMLNAKKPDRQGGFWNIHA